MKAWRFLKNDGTSDYSKSVKVEVGKKYTVEGHMELYSKGLHGSVKPLDALIYAPGNIVTYCDYRGKFILGGDTFVSS